MSFFWLLRMYQWVRNPPSEKAVRFVLVIVAICFALFAIELIWGWPEALTPNSGGRRHMW